MEGHCSLGVGGSSFVEPLPKFVFEILKATIFPLVCEGIQQPLFLSEVVVHKHLIYTFKS